MKENSSVFFVASIGYLCDLPSSARHELINQILLDLYDSLTDQYINSNHRLIVSLKQFTDEFFVVVLMKSRSYILVGGKAGIYHHIGIKFENECSETRKLH